MRAAHLPDSAVALHLYPVGHMPRCDAVWEATRPDRGPVTHDIRFHPPLEAWETEPAWQTAVAYSEFEAHQVAQGLRERKMEGVEIFPRVRS